MIPQSSKDVAFYRSKRNIPPLTRAHTTDLLYQLPSMDSEIKEDSTTNFVRVTAISHPAFDNLKRSSKNGSTPVASKETLEPPTLSTTPSGPLCIVCTLPLSPDPSRRTRVVPCGHEFHHKCILRWFVKVDVPACCLCKRECEGIDVRDD